MKDFKNRPQYTPEKISSLLDDEVFVFGSNLSGFHNGGAANIALKNFGAIYGQGVGLQGKSYAIPTMQGGIETIKPYVDEFIEFAKKQSDRYFYVTRIGCGIAGFKDSEIAPLFKKALQIGNICLPKEFRDALKQSSQAIDKSYFDNIAEEDLTPEKLKRIIITDIIYAEIAESGAMGCAGQAMFYLAEGDKLIKYTTSLFITENLFIGVHNLLLKDIGLKDLPFLGGVEDKKDSVFNYYYGGFGNHVFINKESSLKLSNEYFIFSKDKINYKIYSSVKGVFDAVKQSFSKNNIVANTTDFNHIQWLKEFNEASEKGQGYREKRAEIFQGTVASTQSNGYNIGGKNIEINNSTIFTEFIEKPKPLNIENNYNTTFSVINADCLEIAELLQKAGFNPCVLNLANRQNPGGGVLKGAGAQEENLFRRSNLFMSLFQFAPYASKYGIVKSEKSYPLNRNTGGVYSKNITIFRGSEKNGYCYLASPYQMAFITVPAINRPDLIKRGNLFYIVDELIEPTKEKIRTILRIGGKHQHDSLVLGAFGCGAFRNPPNHIAELFKDVFMEEEFKGAFKYIVFAIFEDHNSSQEHNPFGNVLPFFEVFNLT